MTCIDLDEMNGCEITYSDEINSFILNGKAILILKYWNLLPYGVFNKVDLSKKCVWDNEQGGFERGNIWSICSCLPHPRFKW
jgi:hypothetical protein